MRGTQTRDRLRKAFAERRTKAMPLIATTPKDLSRTLLALRTHPGVGTQRLAELTGTASKGHESRRVRQLAARGLVEPRPRYSHEPLRLTPEGLEVARRIILQQAGLAP